MKNILKDYCIDIYDCEHKTAPLSDVGYPSIRTPNIGKGRLILEDVNLVSEETWREWTKRAIPEFNDLILAREAPAGNVALVPKDTKLCLGQRTVLIKPDKKKISPEFLCYYLLSPKMQHELLCKSGGSTVAHVNVKDIKNLNLHVLPPLPTQQRIASILSAYDDLIENNLKRIKLLEELAQRTYEEWFVKFKFPGHENTVINKEKGLPEGWERKNTKNLINLISGFAFKGDDLIDIPTKNIVVRMGNFKIVGGLKFEKSKYIESSIGINKKYFLEHMDLVMVLSDVTREGLLIGNVGFIPKNGKNYFLNQRVSKIEIDKTLKYLAHATFSSGSFKQNCLNKANSATVLNLKNEDIYSYQFTLPTDDIIHKWNLIYGNYIQIIMNLELQSQLLKESRDILLPRLMGGVIEVGVELKESVA